MSELSCAHNCLNRDEYLKSQNVAVLFAQHKAKTLEDKAKALEADVTTLLKASAEGQQQLNELSNKNAQLQQQLQTTEKALASTMCKLALVHLDLIGNIMRDYSVIMVDIMVFEG
ncbi:hypothetical protein RI054_14g67940 [Pseudoscourfieldia marina]